MTDVIKQNGNKILKQDRYYYVLVIGNKTSLLSSDNSKATAKEEAINTLIKKSNNLENFNNKIIYRITLRKNSKEEKRQEKESIGISFIGGPIVAIVEDIKVIVKNNKVKFNKLGELGNGKIFLNNKYLKKNNNISSSHIKKLAYAYSKDITNSAFAVNTITDILKKV